MIWNTVRTTAILLASICLVSAAKAADAGDLKNGFFRLCTSDNGHITSLQVDPNGKGNYSRSFLTSMGFDYSATQSTSISASRNSIEVSGLTTKGGKSATVSIFLKGPDLLISATTPKGEEAAPLGADIYWNNSGYDISSKSTPFSRFFTDIQFYMDARQLKRWRDNNGWYDHPIIGKNWIELEGTGNWDMRLSSDNPTLTWHIEENKNTLIFNSSPQVSSDMSKTLFKFTAQKRADRIPADWPKFVLPNKKAGEEATTLFYERAFSYQPVWGNAAWAEWMAIGEVWHAGPRLKALKDYLSKYPMSDEGYVNTWGDHAGWPFPDNSKYDTRHFDTNARFILACFRYAAWTGDTDFLRNQAQRLRKAMNYQLTTLHGEDGLIIAAGKDSTGRHKALGNNYWDVLPFGHLDAYANIVWYASCEAMAQIEDTLASSGGIKTPGKIHSPEFYRSLAEKVRKTYNDTFWDDRAGRYIGCIDIDGIKHDYGFTFINLEAIAYGLTSEDKAKRIYHWLETEPTSTGKADTYSTFVFAPRANTIHDPMWEDNTGKKEDCPEDPWWHFGWHGTPYGIQCEDGGGIFYLSYFDLMARLRFMGIDNAQKRWQEIMDRWRLPDHICGGAPLVTGETPQQFSPGMTGTDIPFPESGLVPCWLVYGVLGASADTRGLSIHPNLPTGIPWIEIDNMKFHGIQFNIRATRKDVTIKCTQPGHKFNITKKLDANGSVTFESLR